MKLLSKPVSQKDEALTSYIQRVAKANYLSPHEPWRFIVYKGAKYPQSAMAPLIDYVASATLDL